MEKGKGECKHGRFLGWLKEKMTAEDALFIKFGEKSKELPAEMKKEFTELFNKKKELRKKIYEERKVFMDKWKKLMPEELEYSGHDHFGEGHGCCCHRGW